MKIKCFYWLKNFVYFALLRKERREKRFKIWDLKLACKVANYSQTDETRS